MPRWQFRLRTMFLGAVLVAVTWALLARPVRRAVSESRALAQLRDRPNIQVVLQASEASWPLFPASVVALELRGTLQAGDIALLAPFESLRRLELRNCELEPGALAGLSRLPALEELDLSSSTVDDEGVVRLVGCHGLTTLHLSNTRVTDDGAARLRAALPKLEIWDD